MRAGVPALSTSRAGSKPLLVTCTRASCAGPVRDDAVPPPDGVGEYEATLTFKKKGDATVHSITFPFKIGDRKTLEIP